MSNPEITNIDTSEVELRNGLFADALLTFAGAGTVLKGTLLGRQGVDAAVVAAADAGNTGDGTAGTASVVAEAAIPAPGAYNLECIVAKAVAGAITPGGGNTGNGTVTGLAASATGTPAEVGDYALECTNAIGGDTLAFGSVTAGSNTGNGTVTEGAIDAATGPAEQGTWTVECTDAVTHGGRFKLTDPKGVDVASDIVIVAGAGGIIVYTGAGVSFKITDGSTDFAVGDSFTFPVTGTHGGVFELKSPGGEILSNTIELPGTTGGTVVYTGNGITFTITDGSTDFAVGDSFTIAMMGGEFDVFKLETPTGTIIDNSLVMDPGAGVGTEFTAGGLEFTIIDGSTDFIVGDKFSLTVAANAKYVPYVIGGVAGAGIPAAVTVDAIVATGAGDEVLRPLIGGEVYEDMLVIDADGDGSNITAGIIDQLRHVGIIATASVELNIQDNQ